MPTTITGNAAGFNRGAALSFNGPADTEGIDAADVNVPFQDLADGVEDYRQYGAKTDTTNTFTEVQQMEGANPGANLAALQFTSTVNTLVPIFDSFDGGGGASWHLYHTTTGLVLAYNARYDSVGAEWNQVDAGVDSKAWRISASFSLVVQTKGAGAPAWADGAWGNGEIVANTIQTTAAITAGTSMAATLGDITAVEGNVIAEGTVVGDAGPGLVKARRVYATGTAVDITPGAPGVFGNFTIAGWGAAGVVAAAQGNAQAGWVTITSAGGGALPNPTIQFTYPGGQWGGAGGMPRIIWAMRGTGGGGAYANVSWSEFAATSTVMYLATPAAGGETYTFSWHVVGTL